MLEKRGISVHFGIDNDGTIYQLLDTNHAAWHASSRKVNHRAIGIEIANKGHEFGYQNYSNKQIFSLIKLSRLLIKRFNIQSTNIVGHSDVAFDRKIDPGEKFPWKLLSNKKIGIWHNIDKKQLNKLRKKKLTKSEQNKCLKFIEKIGYFFKKNNNQNKIKLYKNFQRRFRQELINGILDKECLIIAEKLSKIN